VETLPLQTSIRISGVVEVPGDKSISHRAVILGSIANGTTIIENFLEGEDCMRTVDTFLKMGVTIEKIGSTIKIEGKGKDSLKEPMEPIYFGNSGTTARLMLGLLASLPFASFVYGDPSLTRRPMDRVIIPLKEMGGDFIGREKTSYLPIALNGGNLHGIIYNMPVNSAQVKSAILLAGIGAKGKTKVIEKYPTRNHTENMLQAFGATIKISDNEIEVENSNELKATNIFVPGDISSAAFLLTAAAIIPGSSLIINNVGLNSTRAGFLEVLERMGANVTILRETVNAGELMGDIQVTHSPLKGITIEGEIIPRLIDEIPIIALLATQAEGKTIVRNAEELRVKETDRINAIVDVLTTLGASIKATDDGMEIEGKTPLFGGTVMSYHDHRIAMMVVIASLITKGNVKIDELASISISYPNFMDDLNSVIQKDI
jgi:3-phosphoshikimate 1-carboxyvinyltransferase